jgi:hypothetical protein
VIHYHARYSILVGLFDSGLVPFNREARILSDGSRFSWPFLLYKHKVRSKAQIRTAIRTLDEGDHY